MSYLIYEIRENHLLHIGVVFSFFKIYERFRHAKHLVIIFYCTLITFIPVMNIVITVLTIVYIDNMIVGHSRYLFSDSSQRF